MGIGKAETYSRLQNFQSHIPLDIYLIHKLAESVLRDIITRGLKRCEVPCHDAVDFYIFLSGIYIYFCMKFEVFNCVYECQHCLQLPL